jgi:hypothetical protein
MDLFLDTNIYLSFYKLSDDDLEELEKLKVAVGSGDTSSLRYGAGSCLSHAGTRSEACRPEWQRRADDGRAFV